MKCPRRTRPKLSTFGPTFDQPRPDLGSTSGQPRANVGPISGQPWASLGLTSVPRCWDCHVPDGWNMICFTTMGYWTRKMAVHFELSLTIKGTIFNFMITYATPFSYFLMAQKIFKSFLQIWQSHTFICFI